MFICQSLFIGSVIRTTYGNSAYKYDHYGIFDGYGNVIHFTEGDVKLTSLEYFTKESIKTDKNIIEVIGFFADKQEVNPPRVSRERAREMIGNSDKYELRFNNCEHFALYCKISLPYSTQADTISESLKKKNEISSYSSLAGAYVNNFSEKNINGHFIPLETQRMKKK